MLPEDHPTRAAINDEVHARPPGALQAPARLTYLALLSGWADRAAQREHVAALARRFGRGPPAPGANHYRVDFGPFRLTWEGHTEFARYNFIVPGLGPDPVDRPALAEVPADWLAGLTGQTMVAVHGVVLDRAFPPGEVEPLARRLFEGNTLVGSAVAGGAGSAWMDFRIHADGCGRLLMQDRGMTVNQAGRMAQRLLEIETYRMFALLALPVARDLAPRLAAWERELAAITATLSTGGEADEPVLLDRLTRLEAEIGNREAGSHARFSAAAAYYELVQTRIGELREQRIEGLQTFDEFMRRRLAPAMNTCRAVAARQESLSERVSRATQLLATRVALTGERQNQAVLASLDDRARQQLRLQTTVEALSVAAVSYYIVGLIGYLAKGVEGLGLGLDAGLVQGLSVPLVVLGVALAVRRIRRMVIRGEPR
jgi:uncharacterized membrane-anchored protein